MDAPCPPGLLQFLQDVPDPRGRQGQRFPHTAMLAVLVCAQLCGFHGYAAAAQWAKAVPLRLWWALGGGRWPPCANCYRDLMIAVDPDALERALRRWLAEGLGVQLDEGSLRQIVLDGKVLRGTRGRHRRATTVVAALDRATGCVLSRTPVDPSTNEAAASLELLESLVLENHVVILDAAYCQRNVCETIVENGGDYLVIVKENQPNLAREARQATTVAAGLSPLRRAPRARGDALRGDRREEPRPCGTA